MQLCDGLLLVLDFGFCVPGFEVGRFEVKVTPFVVLQSRECAAGNRDVERLELFWRRMHCRVSRPRDCRSVDGRVLIGPGRQCSFV